MWEFKKLVHPVYFKLIPVSAINSRYSYPLDTGFHLEIFDMGDSSRDMQNIWKFFLSILKAFNIVLL